MTMSSDQKLLCDITAFRRTMRLRGVDISETRFGILASRDPRLVSRLRSGKTVTHRTADRIRDYMDDALSSLKADSDEAAA